MNKKSTSNKTAIRRKLRPFPYSTDTLAAALAPWAGPIYASKQINVTDKEFPVIMAAAAEYLRDIGARRAGAAIPRKKSRRVTQRQEALIKVFESLSAKFQAQPFGGRTIERLRTGIIKELGLSDDDGVLSEETIKQDLRQVRHRLAGVKNSLRKREPRQALPRRTRLEMQRGKEAIAAARDNIRDEPVSKETVRGHRPPIDPHVEMPKAVRAAVAKAESHFPLGTDQ